MESSLLLLVFVSHITLCDSQAYAGRKFEIKATVPLPSTDFKALFTVDDSKDMFHRCFFLCERNQQCIGVEICKVKEDLFRCQACCEWKKVKKYGTMSGASNCTYYEQQIDFGTNLALNKSATLSTTQADPKYNPSNAVDGKKYCTISSPGAVSDHSLRPWLLIQLKMTFDVTMVTAFASYYRYELDDITVIVSDGHVNHTCGGQYPGPTQPYDVVRFLCGPGTRGSNITILRNTTNTGYLNVCEVEIFGNP
uniref:Uncharacterized protein LOC111110670 isoform X2 n=1 Tax=Crassostrea virginica TaxID=6565 RepID=A0A8B8BHY0_CRAVI|nr:uncharacterized protein LOC111110670 isoform X2 [Crassostrea virginica]